MFFVAKACGQLENMLKRLFVLYCDLKTEHSVLRCIVLWSIPQICAHPGQRCTCNPDQNQAVPAGGGYDGETR